MFSRTKQELIKQNRKNISKLIFVSLRSIFQVVALSNDVNDFVESCTKLSIVTLIIRKTESHDVKEYVIIRYIFADFERQKRNYR